ncbi:hypothetical protein AX15_004181 [Amanita polypyramis BW_CC]|nr:hypothetical protein AX15_004181 [Amanita polypyramis BW_CC]
MTYVRSLSEQPPASGSSGIMRDYQLFPAASSLPTHSSLSNSADNTLQTRMTGAFGFSLSLPNALHKTLSFTFSSRPRASGNTILNSSQSNSTFQAASSILADTDAIIPVDATASESQSSEIDEDPASQIPRAVSPTPTEIIDDPPVEEIVDHVKACGIKIRDFASQEERHRMTLKAVPEIFDPYRGVAEFEYRLGVKKFRRPVPGKTLRRILDLSWITLEEVEQRCAPMDLEALRTYDEKVAQDIEEGRGVYPWRALKWTNVPTVQERKSFVVKHMWHFVAVDRARKYLEDVERRAQLSREQAEEDERLAREILERREQEEKEQPIPGVLPEGWDSLTLPKLFGREGSRKRSLSNTAKKDGDNNQADRVTYDGDDKDLGDDAHGEPKRIRLSPEGSPSTHPGGSMYPQSQEEYFPLIPPAKQYPAPVSSYDPNIYPEAASIISCQSQKHQQHTPPADPSTQPVTTPPEPQRESTPPVEEASSPRAQSGLRAGLARTQTFTLL